MVVQISWNVHFSCFIVEDRLVDSNLDGIPSFSSNVFDVLVHYLKMEDVGLGVVAGNATFINCTSDMTFISFTLFSKHLLDLHMWLQFSSEQDHV